MKKLKLFFACLLMAVLSIGQVWAAEGDVVYTLNTASTTIATSNSYSNYADATNGWKITLGSKQTSSNPTGLWLGSNSGQKAKMKLSNGSYSEASAIASALGIEASATYYAAIIGTNALENVGKVTLTYGATGGKAIEGGWILYSTNDGESWSVAKSLTSFNAEGTDFVFDATIASARYAFVMYCSAWGSLKVPVLTFYEGATGGNPKCATPTFSPTAGDVVSGTEVTISSTTEGATIYYTTDGTDPTTSSSTSQPVVIDATKTIKAIAVAGGYDNSSVASATYTVVTPYTTIQDLFEAKTSTSTPVYITFGGWKISGVKGSQAFLTDGAKGLIIYQSSHGFVVGDALTGTAACNLIAYKGAVELTGLTSTSTGLTVTHGSMSDAVAKTIDELGAVNTSALVTISNVTYDGTNLSDGTNSIKPYNGLFSSMSFENGKKYNVTGVLNYYDALQIMPRSADDIVEVVDPGKVATPTFDPEGGEFSEAQNVTISCATEDATIYYTIDGTDPSTSSSVYSTAIAVSETTTIKAFAVKAEMTNSDIASATYTITGPQVTFNYVDYKGQGGPSGTGSSYTMADKPAVSIGNDKFFGNNSYAHFYAGGTITITPATGVTITRIVLTASAAGYNGYQSEGSITASTGSLSHDGAVVTWTGSADAAFTLENDKQIRWLTIVVSYEEADPSAPALAVDPTVIDFGDVEQGSTVDAQTVAVNFANLTGEVTYSGLSSPFSATGTISATGDLISISADATVEVGEYEQTLTVTSAADSKSATVTVTMNVVPAETGEQFVKVTATPAESDWTGDYLLVYESGTTAYVWDGTDDAEKCKTATIKSGNKIIKPEGAAVVSIEAVTGGHSLQISGGTNDGKYIVDNGNNSGLKFGDAAYATTITYETDWTKILFSQRCIRYNSSSGQERFRYYADNSQQAVQLYKAVNSKAPAGLAYETTAVEKLASAEAFTNAITNPNTLTVAYSSSNTDVATVDAASGEVTIVAAGVAEITASTLGDETHKAGSAKYTVCVTAHAGTEADPYTVADAKIVIDALGTKAGVYASGIICQVDAIDLTENFYATYWISADGLTDGQKLEAYHGKYLNNADFSADDDIKVGDEVVIVGNLKKFGTSIYEFDGGNYLTSLSRTKVAAGLAYAVAAIEKNVGDANFTNELTNPNGVTVAYSSNDASVASVDAATGEVTVNAMGEATITATFAGNDSYLPGSASYTVNVSDPSITKVTFDAAVDMTASSEVLTLTKNGVTMEISKGQMHNGVSYRLNKDNTLTLSCADGLITRIELEGTDPSYAVTNITAAGYSNGVWTGSAESVDLVASVAQARMTKINVYYGADSREVAGLAYAVTAIEKNEGDAKFTNELTNPNSVTVAYSSSNASVASVDAETGEVTINAAGEAIITASFAGNATYKSANVSYTITVNAPAPTPSGTTYRKVTATENITDGEYLIVYEGDATHDAYAFNGSLDDVDQAKKGVAVTISEGVIAGTAAIDAAVFTINVTAGTLQSASGWYIGRTENSNGMEKNETTEYVNTFAISEGEAVITSSGGPTLRYNYASDQLRFRYYKSGQQPIQLYKKETAPEPPTKDLIRGGLSNGKWGTLCPAQNVENVEGAEFFLLSFLEEKDGLPYNVVFDEIEGPNLQAGKPYFFIANAEEIRGNKTGEPLDVADPAGVNGFYGYIGASSMALTVWQDAYDEDEDNTFVIHDNKVVRINQPGTMLPSERCYININKEVPSRTAVAKTYGRRRITVGVSGTNAAQGFENLDASEKPLKVMIEGTLYILRGEKVYDATGRLVK